MVELLLHQRAALADTRSNKDVTVLFLGSVDIVLQPDGAELVLGREVHGCCSATWDMEASVVLRFIDLCHHRDGFDIHASV